MRQRVGMLVVAALLAYGASVLQVVAPAQARSPIYAYSLSAGGTGTTTYVPGGHVITIDANGIARCLGGASGGFHMYSSVSYAIRCLDSTGLGLVNFWMPNGDYIIVGLTVVGDSLTGIGKVEAGPHRGQAAVISLVSSRNLAACPNFGFSIHGVLEDT